MIASGKGDYADEISRKEMVVRWQFSQLDKNKNEVVIILTSPLKLVWLRLHFIYCICVVLEIRSEGMARLSK